MNDLFKKSLGKFLSIKFGCVYAKNYRSKSEIKNRKLRIKKRQEIVLLACRKNFHIIFF